MTKTQSILIGGLIGSSVVLAQNPSWSKEPESFRGAKFLASESEVRSKFQMADCISRDNDEKTCFFYFNLASAEIASVATFQRDALVDVSGVFSQDVSSTVLDVFTAGYDAAPSRNADQFSWIGRTVSIKLDRVVTGERRANVKAIVSTYCEAQLGVASKIASHAASLGLGSAATQKADYERDVARAESQCQKFSSVTYGLFSITVNDYAVQIAKRSEEEKKKAASGLK